MLDPQISGQGSLIPGILILYEAPAPLVDGRQYARIHHNANKRAMESVLKHFHSEQLPKRFASSAASKYKHKARGRGYKAKKRAIFRSVTDLIKSRKTKHHWLGRFPKIVHRRTGSDLLHASLVLPWPFPVSRDNKSPRGVKIRDMAAEVHTWLPDEVDKAAEIFAQVYRDEMVAGLNNAPRLKKRVGDAGGIIV